ncbi:MAG: hypothetical protein WCQ03_10590, partial [Phycisphaerae bacterium]
HQTICHQASYQPTAVRTAVAQPTRHWPVAVLAATGFASINPTPNQYSNHWPAAVPTATGIASLNPIKCVRQGSRL